ncbi:L-aspartate oxidase [Rhodococcoides trifolii]|uniref:L-aspartate oxidase n=1 Tax=Rhodococcoides trifolii TaxID=908250 RepID=A0A917D4T8_9NOCA|nr:L-aspartate oxidase [Rhodococcus trifolii]GGG11910.1 L-aspartate oxidase [Rhodococcus trifolii]
MTQREGRRPVGSQQREGRRPAGSQTWEVDADLVVVGGGVAGLAATIEATRRGLRVVTVAKADPGQTSTQYAQGGIAISYGDDIASHVADTCVAGAGLCDELAVWSILSSGAAALDTLVGLGARFDTNADGSFALTREGGHAISRIVHAGGDATGAEVQRVLSSAATAVLVGTTAVRVLTGPSGAAGVLVTSEQGVGVLRAPAVLLATGGLGQLFSCSTNPAAATGDGIAMALRAGAVVSDLEFVQFHPTVLFDAAGVGRRPLISEAVRGEGARLVDVTGRSVMAGVHPLGDLAPRDIVSRAIATRLRETGGDHVLLDARGIDDIAHRFPTVTASCLAAGIDPSVDLIPVAPAAHYSCGGVVTDVHGRTAVPGLYAAGEVARTGLHGANRLASNSLVEGAVVGARAGVVAAERRGLLVDIDADQVDDVVSGSWTQRRMPRSMIQEVMTTHVGVVRDGSGLRSAAVVFDSATDQSVSSGVEAEDAALTLVGTVMVAAAALRAETRGAHTRLDRDGEDPQQRRSTTFGLDADGAVSALELAGVA